MKHTSIKDLDKEEDPTNWLFFPARNLAIELVLRNISARLKDDLELKEVVVSNWIETSHYSPTIEIVVKHKTNPDRNIFVTVRVYRDVLHPAPRCGSACIYSLSPPAPALPAIFTGEIRTKKEAKISTYAHSKDFVDFLREEIKSVNYPFPYKHYSGF